MMTWSRASSPGRAHPRIGHNETGDPARTDIEALIAAQDQQIAVVHEAAARYDQTGDVDTYIAFWEQIWSTKEGLLFNGSRWTFELVDLYIQTGQRDKAWGLLNRFVVERPDYLDKTRKLQIEILKSEGRDSSQIEALRAAGK